MIGDRLPLSDQRTSLRQAVLVDGTGFTSPELASDPLRQAILLDLLGSLVGVNGVTISLLSAGSDGTAMLSLIVPPGIDLLTPPIDRRHNDDRLGWAVELLLERSFARIVAIAADVPALPTRTVATALSALAGADVVVGGSDAGLYLLGVRDEYGLELLRNAGAGSGLDRVDVAALRAAAERTGSVLRYVERRSRFSESRPVDAVREAVGITPSAAPRTIALLRAQSEPRRANAGTSSLFSGNESGYLRSIDR